MVWKRKQLNTGLRFIAALLGAALFFSVALNTAEAGLFSFFKDLSATEAANAGQSQNLQTAQILAATRNPLDGARGGGDITIVNQSALLPDAGPLGTIADIGENRPGKDQISTYVIRPGDTLSEIADMFDVSVNTIMWANDIRRGGEIRVGQTIVILPISGIQHTIKSGETLAGIAKKYAGDVDEILNFNGLAEGAVLAAGEVLIIPNGEAAALPSTSTTYAPTRGVSVPTFANYYQRPIYGGRKTQGVHGYNGVDLADTCGAPILASADGTVLVSRRSGWNGGYGNYIVIGHQNGTQTLYAHNGNNVVLGGTSVVQGQVIGSVGSTGKSTGCHVHFEVRGARNPF